MVARGLVVILGLAVANFPTTLSLEPEGEVWVWGLTDTDLRPKALSHGGVPEGP